MIREYGKKRVVAECMPDMSIVIEQKGGDLVAKIYERDWFNRCTPKFTYRLLDIKRVQNISIEIRKVREITRQLGTGGYVIHSNAIPLIKAEL